MENHDNKISFHDGEEDLRQEVNENPIFDFIGGYVIIFIENH